MFSLDRDTGLGLGVMLGLRNGIFYWLLNHILVESASSFLTSKVLLPWHGGSRTSPCPGPFLQPQLGREGLSREPELKKNPQVI